MLFASLCQLERSEQRDYLPPYYGVREIRWLACFAGSRFVGWKRLTEGEIRKGAKVAPGKKLTVPDVRRGVGMIPYPFSDRASATLDFGEPENQTRAAKYREVLIAACQKFADTTQIAALEQTMAWLKEPPEPPETMEPHDFILFADANTGMDNAVPFVNFPQYRELWAEEQSERTGGKDDMECFVCGKMRQPVRVFPGYIFGVPKTLHGRAALVSANDNSTWHYGRKQSMLAPCCVECATDAYKALNRLIATPELRYLTGNLVNLFWTIPSNPDVIAALMRTLRYADESFVRRAVAGNPSTGPDVHILTIAGRQSRVLIRGYNVVPFPVLWQNLGNWYRTQGEEGPWFPPCRTWDDKEEQMVPGLMESVQPTTDLERTPVGRLQWFVEGALLGKPLPHTLGITCLLRDKAERESTDARRAVAKLTMAYSPVKQEGNPVNLIDRPSYRCGRLLAILEAIQNFAVSPNRTLADKFMRAASNSPRAILGSLLLKSKAHLSKLARYNRAGSLQAALEEATMDLEMPERLDATGQAEFALGYFNTCPQFIRKKKEVKVANGTEEKVPVEAEA